MRRGDSEKPERPVLLRLFQGQARHPPTAVDWDERRARHQARPKPPEARVDSLAEISWLSMVCFVEAIDPSTLGLSEELAIKVRDDLETLEGHDTLEMYWSCLDRLRRLGSPENQGESDAADSE